ncbi:MAG: Sapep family Mn(2+)-dependent dipeptidase [Clostridiales bacterium]|nr:Sapep family Mn(2+)-dependent dipeptidase [Clostridiales bacterium]
MYEAEIRAWFEAHRQEYLDDLATLVAIPSDRGEPQPDAPFGAGPLAALNCALNMAKGYGFQARSYDNYVGLVDLNDGPRHLDVLAHLDVVPAGEGWTVTEPFTMKRLDGRLYGRGTADDKGPALAALYAMRCVRDLGMPVTKNCRLILGTDEECGSGDIAHYYASEPEAPMSFSPDASYPVINVEKGHFSGGGEKTLSAPLGGNLVSFHAGVKGNVIPGKARCVLSGLAAADVQAVADAVAAETGAAFTLTAEGNALSVLAEGEQGHASMPAHSNNALTALLALVCRLPLAEDEGTALLKKLHARFPHGDYGGKAAGIAYEDDSGALTICLNILDAEGDKVSFTWDCRVPVSETEEQLRVLTRGLEEDGFTVRAHFMPPHCVPEDTPFVQTLLRCYERFTGQKGYCYAIGGGTYVHHLKNGVAFGCTFPGTENNMHGADESAVEEELIASGEIFALAIGELCR